MIYTAFIYITEKEKEMIPAFQCLYSSVKWEYNDATQMWQALYAWTTSKKWMKKFKKMHDIKHFKYVIQEDNPEIMETLKTKFECCELIKAQLRTLCIENNSLTKEVTLIITQDEDDIIREKSYYLEEIYNNETVDNSSPQPDPYIFTREVQSLLMTIGFTEYFFGYNLSIPDDGDVPEQLITLITDHVDFASSELRYNMNQIDIDELQNYIRNYKLLLRG